MEIVILKCLLVVFDINTVTTEGGTWQTLNS